MPLKETNKDNLEYLDKLFKDNGLEIILPDLNKEKKEKDNKKKDNK